MIHKIPHEGTTVIQVLRTNKRIYEDDENDDGAEAETGSTNMDVGEEGEKNDDVKSEENDEDDGEETRAHHAKKSEEEKEKSEEAPAAAEVAGKIQNTKRRKSGKQGKSAGSKKNKDNAAAKAKKDSLKTDKGRERLDRHLLDHLLARGLVEMLGPDALAKLENQTDGVNQPGVSAADGDLLASAKSVASLFSSGPRGARGDRPGGCSGSCLDRLGGHRRPDRGSGPGARLGVEEN